MISTTLLALGAYRFAAGVGLNDTDRQTEWRWQFQDVIGAPPAGQFVGPGEDCMTIRGTIYPHYRGGLGQVDQMRAQAGLGVPLILVDGTGRYYGLWAITSIQEGKTFFMPDGAPRKIEFTLQIKKYS